MDKKNPKLLTLHQVPEDVLNKFDSELESQEIKFDKGTVKKHPKGSFIEYRF